MGFFSNPRKAFKGFCKDPIGRIGKDLGIQNKPPCNPSSYAKACGQGATSQIGPGAVGGAVFGAFVGPGGVSTGAIAGAASGAASGCYSGVSAQHAVCRISRPR